MWNPVPSLSVEDGMMFPTTPSRLTSLRDPLPRSRPRPTEPNTVSMLDLLYPLSEFFRRGEPRPLAALEADNAPMPEPYRSLLVHDSDMTSTLERFHGEPLELRLLARREEDESLFRQVVLTGSRSGRPVEFGAIRIDLAAFDPEPRRLILESRQPLGSILAQFNVLYASRPRLFFHVESNDLMSDALGLQATATLYGRQNVLSAPDGRSLAEVVEILPPVTASPELG